MPYRSGKFRRLKHIKDTKMCLFFGVLKDKTQKKYLTFLIDNIRSKNRRYTYF